VRAVRELLIKMLLKEKQKLYITVLIKLQSNYETKASALYMADAGVNTAS
jgi:hypothetical protein